MGSGRQNTCRIECGKEAAAASTDPEEQALGETGIRRVLSFHEIFVYFAGPAGTAVIRGRIAHLWRMSAGARAVKVWKLVCGHLALAAATKETSLPRTVEAPLSLELISDKRAARFSLSLVSAVAASQSARFQHSLRRGKERPEGRGGDETPHTHRPVAYG